MKWIVYIEDNADLAIEKSDSLPNGIVEISYKELMMQGRERIIPPQDVDNETEMVTLLYTSGSTNRPKGMLSFCRSERSSHI